jgi:hypothetical protein
MKVNVEVQRTAQMLDKSDRTGHAVSHAGDRLQVVTQLLDEEREQLRLQLRIAGAAVMPLERHHQHELT